MISHDKCCKRDLEFAEDSFWKQSPVGVCLNCSQGCPISVTCAKRTLTHTHTHTRTAKQQRGSHVRTLLMTTTYQHNLRGRRRNPDRCADSMTHAVVGGKPEQRGLFSLGRIFFWINKQLNMSVPPKSHQQSVRSTISGEMRSIYTVSPEATSLAQTCITYYISAITAAGHSRGKLCPLQGKDCLETCLFTDDWTKALSFNAENRKLKLRLPTSNHIIVKDLDVIRIEDYFWVFKNGLNARVTEFGNSQALLHFAVLASLMSSQITIKMKVWK